MKKIIKKILGNDASKKLGNIYFRFNNFKRFVGIKVSTIFTFSSSVSTLYYLFTGEFGRESYSSLKGRQAFVKSAGMNNSLYRRNIHRLEKAMIMRPRRNKFAEDYINQLVHSHRLMKDQVTESQFEWGQNVLTQYFSLVEEGTSAIIDKARSEFFEYSNYCEAQQELLANSVKKVPFPYEARESTNITYDEFYALAKARKSIRWFKDKPVDISLLHKAVNVASQAPSACNRQPFSFYFTNEAAKAQHIGSLAMGSSGFLNNISSMIAVVGDLSYFDCAHDRHVIYIDSSLATMQLLLSFETLGLASCVLNWPDIKSRDEKLSSYLNLASHERVICLIAVGYPDEEGLTPYSEKKPSSELIKEI